MKALACTLVAILAMVWPSATAVALDITFDDVVSVNNPLLTTLDVHGYRVTGLFHTIDTPGGPLPDNGSAVYLHQEASGPGITLTRADGGPFALYAFDAVGRRRLRGTRGLRQLGPVDPRPDRSRELDSPAHRAQTVVRRLDRPRQGSPRRVASSCAATA